MIGQVVLQSLRSAQTRVYEIVESARPGDRASALFDAFIISLIAANIVVFILETIEPLRLMAPGFFYGFELISVAIFTAEYVVRIWSCTLNLRFRHPITGRLRFAAGIMPLIDLLAIAPFYLPVLGLDLRAFRALRLFRLLRIAKLGRYTSALGLIGHVVRSKREELITTVVFILLLLLFASSLMYFAERDIQPEVFGSIPASMWWAVTTLTTVGYGDVSPVTPVGKVLGSVVAILGVGIFALPTGILGSGFVEAIENQKSKSGICPTCVQIVAGSVGSGHLEEQSY